MSFTKLSFQCSTVLAITSWRKYGIYDEFILCEIAMFFVTEVQPISGVYILRKKGFWIFLVNVEIFHVRQNK